MKRGSKEAAPEVGGKEDSVAAVSVSGGLPFTPLQPGNKGESLEQHHSENCIEHFSSEFSHQLHFRIPLIPLSNPQKEELACLFQV